MIRFAALFLSGLIFALGLGISGMTLPAKVLGFLDVTGAWDPSLLFVMGTAIPVYALAHRLSLRAARPLLAAAFPVLPRQPVDRKLVLGATLFGAGWGIAGVCPGPALVNLGGHAPGAALFVAAMLGGMALHRWSSTRIPAIPNPFTLLEKELT
ncbi:MAG: hypothetical protein NVS2B9_20200 [Myxococcales bacterium]